MDEKAVAKWMNMELNHHLELYVDESNCPNFTKLGEAWAAEHWDEEEIPEEVWDAAADAFDPWLGELNV